MSKEEILNTFLLANIPEIITQEEFDDAKKAIFEILKENQKLKAINEEHRKINGELREENKMLNITNSSCAFCPYNNAKIERDKYKEVIDKIRDILNKMMYIGYSKELNESTIQYMATGEKSEFGARAKIILDILKEVE